jgi:hypothetical protein
MQDLGWFFDKGAARLAESARRESEPLVRRWNEEARK